MGRPVTKGDRLRRVVLLCAHFARNMAYYRAGHNRLTKESPQFWITVDCNFIDAAVIEWCKLFDDPSGKHFWGKVVGDPLRFEVGMLSHLGMSASEFAAYVNKMRRYRDKFVAHLDDLAVMDIPFLDTARAAVEFYHSEVVKREADTGDLVGLPSDLTDYYRRCFDQAWAITATVVRDDGDCN